MSKECPFCKVGERLYASSVWTCKECGMRGTDEVDLESFISQSIREKQKSHLLNTLDHLSKTSNSKKRDFIQVFGNQISSTQLEFHIPKVNIGGWKVITGDLRNNKNIRTHRWSINLYTKRVSVYTMATCDVGIEMFYDVKPSSDFLIIKVSSSQKLPKLASLAVDLSTTI